DLMAGSLRARLADRSMTLDLGEPARAFIARQGFDPVYGARPLRRYIAPEVETPIARALIAGDVPDCAVIKVWHTDGKLGISYDTPIRPAMQDGIWRIHLIWGMRLAPGARSNGDVTVNAM